MRSSYKEGDVIFLLKDITGLVKPQSTEEREKEIQAGRHYCEMLPIEYVPTQKYMEVYREALEHYARPTALAVGALADKIIKEKGGACGSCVPGKGWNPHWNSAEALSLEKISSSGAPLFNFHYPGKGN